MNEFTLGNGHSR